VPQLRPWPNETLEGVWGRNDGAGAAGNAAGAGGLGRHRLPGMKYVVESLGKGAEKIEAGCVVASSDWIIFYEGNNEHKNHVLAAFPTAQVFRVIPDPS